MVKKCVCVCGRLYWYFAYIVCIFTDVVVQHACTGDDILSCLGNTTDEGGVHSATGDGIVRRILGMGKGGPLDDFLAVVVVVVVLGTDDRGDAKVFGS